MSNLDPIKTRSGKSLCQPALFEHSNSNLTDSLPATTTSVSSCFSSIHCNSSLRDQHHNPEAIWPHAPERSTPSENDVEKTVLDCEILEEELAIRLEELELRKLRLRIRKQKASSRDDFKEQPLVTGSVDDYRSLDSEKREPPYVMSPTHPASYSNKYHVSSGESLPRIEIEKFDGDVLKFCKFIKIFESNIASRLPDDRQRLLYLMHYCCGDAREAIEHCVFLSDDVAYMKAMSILKSQFGRSHDIVRSFLNELLNGEKIAPNDINGLRKLVRQMTNCELALSQLDRDAELNCSTTLKHLVERLPRFVCQKWAERADEILSSGHEPTFMNLVTFLEKHISIATNSYGLIANKDKSYALHEPKRSTIFFTDSRAKCPQCMEEHSLSQCHAFCSLSRSEKLEFLRSRKLCFNCFHPNHRAPTCKVSSRCNVNGCDQKHNFLLHDTGRDHASSSGARINSLCTERTKTYLGFVAVRVVGPNGTKDTYALLDNGSDSTLITKNLARELGINGERTRIEVTSVNGTQLTDTSAVSLSIQSLLDDCVIDVKRAYVIESLPTSRACLPTDSELTSWPHLRDVQPIRLSTATVSMLIGSDVPGAHWITQQRIGSPRQPYASLTSLGWTILGPADATTTKANEVLSLHCTIDEHKAKVFDSDFSKRKYLERVMPTEDQMILLDTSENTEKINNHYEVPVSRQFSWDNFPPNRYMAGKHLEHLRMCLIKDKYLLNKYNGIIKQYGQKGYVTRLGTIHSGSIRFLYGHPMENAKKPAKPERRGWDEPIDVQTSNHRSPESIIHFSTYEVLSRVRRARHPAKSHETFVDCTCWRLSQTSSWSEAIGASWGRCWFRPLLYSSLLTFRVNPSPTLTLTLIIGRNLWFPFGLLSAFLLSNSPI